MSVKYLAASLALLFAAGGAPALGQVKIGVITSATGPTAMVGIPQKNTVPLLPTQIGDLTEEWLAYAPGFRLHEPGAWQGSGPASAPGVDSASRLHVASA